jgi:hypothetical protein
MMGARPAAATGGVMALTTMQLPDIYASMH